VVQDRREQRLYKIAYLKFKKARFQMFEEWDVLSEVYGLGWTAHREWIAWKRLVGKGEGRRRWRRRGRRRGLLLDGVQANAERRNFEMGNGPIRRVEHLK
jgi:hypothetical protein